MLTRADIFATLFSIIRSVNTQCTGPDINRASLELIKEFEGFVSSPYSDPVGYPTVGYGHLCSSSSCSDVDFSFPLSEETATQLLEIDLGVRLAQFTSIFKKWGIIDAISPNDFPKTKNKIQEYQDGLTESLSDEVHLNANQYGALVSWTYNMGVGAVADSTLVARLNEGEDPESVVVDELPQWVHAGSRVLSGLVRRRNEEIDLFTNDTSVRALPIPC